MRRYLFLIAICFIFIRVAKAQIPKPPVNVPSPNAFQFAKYGNTSVNLFNGQPSIQVPLNTIQIGDFTLNASLNYDAAGFRPDVFPSWVGQNWNLNIGGVLTRKVRGIPDEFNFTIDYQSATFGNQTYWFPNGYINRRNNNDFTIDNLFKTSGSYYTGICGGDMIKSGHSIPYLPDQSYYMVPLFSGSTSYGLGSGESWPTSDADNLFSTWQNNDGINGNSGGIQDMYPDEFSFNAFGVSGKFYFKKHGPYSSTENWEDVFAIQCEKKVKIIPFFDIQDDTSHLKMYQIPLKPYNCGDQATTDQRYYNYSPWSRGGRYPKILAGFTVQTDDGISLTFGRDVIKTATSLAYFNELPIELSTDLHSCTDYWTADSWFLSQAILSNGKRIDFEYERGGFLASKFMSAYDAKINDALNFMCQDYEHGRTYVNGKAISPVYLTKVFGENFQWDIHRSESSQLPMNIDFFTSTVSNYVVDYPFNKRYKVDSIVFNNNDLEKTVRFNYVNTGGERLRLGNVINIDAAGHLQEKYQFGYINDAIQPVYLSKQVDHWGFWNGQTSSFPPQTSGNVYYNSRESNFYYAKQGLLNSITYPTGGTTSFEYEPNNCLQEVKMDGVGTDLLSSNKTIGGVRIREIIDQDGVTAFQNKRRYYYIADYNNSMTESQIASAPSSGVLNSQIKYRWTNNSVFNSSIYTINYNGDYCTINDPQLITSTIDIFSTQPLYYLYDNYHVGYTKVYEVATDNSYLMNEYSNHDNGYVNGGYSIYSFNINFESPFNRSTDRGFERGKLLKLKYFSNTNTLLKEKTIEYVRKLYADQSKNSFSIWEGSILFSGGCGSVTPSLNGFRFAAFGNRYSVDTYPFLPSHEKIVVYDKDNVLRNVVTDVEYFYEGLTHFYPTKIKTYNSKGEEMTTLQKYAYDYPGIFMMQNIIKAKPSTVLEKIELKKDMPTNTQMVVGAQVNEYGLSTGTNMPWLNSVYKLRLNKPFNFNSFQATVPITRDFNSTSIYSKDSRYEEVFRINKFDGYYNALNMAKQNGERNVVIMGNRNNNIIASVVSQSNFNSSDARAYTSFESYNYHDWEGNIFNEMDAESDFVYTGATSADAFSGTKSFNGRAKYKKQVFGGIIYVLAKHGGNAPLLEKLYPNGSVYSTENFTLIAERDGWDIYKYLTGGGTILQVNSNGNIIDELRITTSYSNDFMTTYTYNNGVLSCVVDNNYKREFYEYDASNRLYIIRDNKNNILKKICYNYAGQQENCGGNSTPQWQATDSLRCVKGVNGKNTGYQEKQERDMNAYSATYNALRWVDNGYNPTACPLPTACDYNSCSFIYGESFACIDGECEQGYQVYTNSYYDFNMGMYACTYHYEFSDGSWSANYIYYSRFECLISV